MNRAVKMYQAVKMPRIPTKNKVKMTNEQQGRTKYEHTGRRLRNLD